MPVTTMVLNTLAITGKMMLVTIMLKVIISMMVIMEKMTILATFDECSINGMLHMYNSLLALHSVWLPSLVVVI